MAIDLVRIDLVTPSIFNSAHGGCLVGYKSCHPRGAVHMVAARLNWL